MAREAFSSSLASGAPFMVRIDIDANPDGFGGLSTSSWEGRMANRTRRKA
jgi:hypothetical protein